MALILAVFSAGFVAGCSPPAGEAPPSVTPWQPTASSGVEALPPAVDFDPSELIGRAKVALGSLPVKDRAPLTGYERWRFGEPWADADGNGCDTRNDILRRDLTDQVLRDPCVVSSGVLAEPYGGRSLAFVRGVATSAEVQIDHVVALADAWQKGGQQLDEHARVLLANDPLNLLAVSGPLNQQKGAGDAATWLPPNRAFRCEYVSRQVLVKQEYHLWLTSAEQAAMARVLGRC